MKLIFKKLFQFILILGEPLNHEAWMWFNNLVGEGRCDLVDTWWQTETGGIAIAPRPSGQAADILPVELELPEVAEAEFRDLISMMSLSLTGV